MASALASFDRDGVLGPVRVLTSRECRIVSRHLENGRPPPADWSKGGAVTDWLLYQLAASPRLLRFLTPILGEDIVLWGSSVVRRRPGEIHPWHVDIEASTAKGRFVTAWIGLENTSRTGLQLIAGSHMSDQTIQQIQCERGSRRGEAGTETVLAWARERNPDANLVEPELANGDAVLFDGRLWHGSRNARTVGTRSALLLQFAAADTPVRMPDPSQLEWPFRFLSTPRPPAVLVHGTAASDANRLVPPPAHLAEQRLPMLSSCIRSVDLPLAEHPDGGWQPHPLFRGSTRVVGDMACHAAVLSGGHMPHPPHAHRQEELLIVLDGEAELLVAVDPRPEGARVERVRKGDFAYYPAFQHHTIRNPGTSPVTYLMFKWHAAAGEAAQNPLGTTIVRGGSHSGTEVERSTGFVTRTLFEQPTGLLGRLHCHRTELAPGASYAPHVDAYDVAILVMSGRVETLGQEVGPCGVIYYSAGETHGMRNIGDAPAHYLVFEFHAPGVELRQLARRRVMRLARQLAKRVARRLGLLPVRRQSSAALHP